MTYKEFKSNLDELNMTVKEFAEYMQIKVTTINSWNSERTNREVPYYVPIILKNLKENMKLKREIVIKEKGDDTDILLHEAKKKYKKLQDFFDKYIRGDAKNRETSFFSVYATTLATLYYAYIREESTKEQAYKYLTERVHLEKSDADYIVKAYETYKDVDTKSLVCPPHSNLRLCQRTLKFKKIDVEFIRKSTELLQVERVHIIYPEDEVIKIRY